MRNRQRIAIVGSGISGLTAAYLLSKKHDVSLYEANDYLGGHTHTKNVMIDGNSYPVNTGFIVFNDWTYPNFIKLMDQLGVQSEASDMSFSVKCEETGLEYNGTSLNGLFSQRLNLITPSFLRMVYDIISFNKSAVTELKFGNLDETKTLGNFLIDKGYSDKFIKNYIVPMGAAIWSSSYSVMMNFPLKFFLQFFHNHGMLSINNRPEWRVISGGSQSYIEPLIKTFKDNVHLNTPIKKVIRNYNGVVVVSSDGVESDYDHIVFACHSDQALKILHSPTKEENEILSSIVYKDNQVVLHTDIRLLPSNKRAWASWNYHISSESHADAMVTYNMNMLQNFDIKNETLLVTLNRCNEIAPEKIIQSYTYSHPVFNAVAVEAQQRHSEISGINRPHYCGAYWFNGFHEDGVNSALRVAKYFGIEL